MVSLPCKFALGLSICLFFGSAQADDWTASQLSCPQHLPVSQQLPALQPAASAGQGVLVYLWSPRMVLSVLHAHEAQQVAQRAGLAWLPLLDPRLPQVEAQDALITLSPAQAAALRPVQNLCDQKLLQAGQTLRHFPTAWVFRRAPTSESAGEAWQQQGLPIVSAMPAGYWQQAVAERLSQRLNQP